MRRFLIIVVAAVLLAGAFTAWQVKKNMDEARQQAKINALHEALKEMRGAIAKFHEDRGRYPHSLIELMPVYLLRIPVDPMTGAADTWRLTTEETVQPSEDFRDEAAPKSESVVIDVHSSAPGYSND
jgi:general secretion pathway protein G